MWTRSKLSEKYQIFQRHPEDILPTTPLKIIIGEDEGGYINKYSEHWRNAAARGTEVDVLGKCQSACTLVLAHIPESRLCFGEKSWATGGAVPDDTHRQPAAGALELVPGVHRPGGVRLLAPQIRTRLGDGLL